MSLELSNRKIDEYGIVYTDVEKLYDLLMEDMDINRFKVVQSEQLDVYNQSVRTTDEEEKRLEAYVKPSITIEEFDQARQEIWFIPDEYKNIDMYSYIMGKVTTEIERERVEFEYNKFVENDLVMVLKALLYLTDTFKKHNIVKGVGRGSSVSSYILYLLDVHKVDSLKYGLDFNEFLE